ncbi:unnamed protein product [Pleuronectes platessa]|uniref:Uncharacterized protein n=1 Tax=Pleuronectes platessa TaxID=8262 RepID=A0A9N7YEX3_PLEPL|nr:unnamed protein product [Pleuronectes platessa]
MLGTLIGTHRKRENKRVKQTHNEPLQRRLDKTRKQAETESSSQPVPQPDSSAMEQRPEERSTTFWVKQETVFSD